MSYSVQVWADNNPAYPVSAARMAYIEAGIAAVANGGFMPAINVAVPTGVLATDAANLAAAVAAANASGGHVDVALGPGTYVGSAALAAITVPGVKIKGHGSDITTLDLSAASTGAKLLNPAGSEGTHYALASDASEGDTTISVAAGVEANFTVGQYAKVASSGFFDTRTNTHAGEIVLVKATGSGLITIVAPLAGASYLVSDSAFIAPLVMLSGIAFEGLTILGGGSGSQHQGLRLDYTVDAVVEDVKIKNCETYGLALSNSINTQGAWVRSYGENRSADGYGLVFLNASQDCKIIGYWAENCRHACTHGSDSTDHGVSRRNTVENGTGYYTTGDCWDTHSCCESFAYLDCDSYYSGVSGFNIENPSGRIRGRAFKPVKYGVQLSNGTSRPTKYDVDVDVVDSTDMGIRYTESTTVGAGSTIRSVKIKGSVSNAGSTALYVAEVSDSWRMSNVTCDVSISATAGGVTEVVHIEKVDDSDFAVLVEGAPAAASAFRLKSVTNSRFTRPVNFASLSTGVGFNCTNTCTDLAFVGLPVRNAGTGIKGDSSCSNFVGTACDLTTCTTPLSLSTGTGHNFFGNPGAANVGSLTAANYQLLSTNASTFTVPTGITKLRIRAIGGGGGGGGGGATSGTTLQAGGGGGAAGTIVEAEVTVAAGDVLTMTIPAASGGGNGGTGGGNNPGSNGTSGGNVVVVNTTAGTTLLTAQGGTKGNGAAANTATQPGGGLYGNGSASVTAAQMWPGCGAPGGANSLYPIGPVVGGAGGGPASTTLGGGAGGAQLSAANLTIQTAGGSGTSGTTSGVTGTTATMPGCGGGGGGGGGNATGTGGTGGSGALGQVEIWW